MVPSRQAQKPAPHTAKQPVNGAAKKPANRPARYDKKSTEKHYRDILARHIANSRTQSIARRPDRTSTKTPSSPLADSCPIERPILPSNGWSYLQPEPFHIGMPPWAPVVGATSATIPAAPLQGSLSLESSGTPSDFAMTPSPDERISLDSYGSLSITPDSGFEYTSAVDPRDLVSGQEGYPAVAYPSNAAPIHDLVVNNTVLTAHDPVLQTWLYEPHGPMAIDDMIFGLT
ncbi:hypothetical protein CAC42_4740 [Sphaceloma murrayae]|uniref:Uncharacterized protein n=1 Tax=Sphaceloma murrayae TaxID=2082308 RepID=A0A2K1QNS7_9PEZI|nr:hypothetical protein CAC42_4740 [Sphaceloma murrayae]